MQSGPDASPQLARENLLSQTRATIHYLAIFVILIVYGAEVCPFLAELSTWELALTTGISMLLAYVLRFFMLPFIVLKSNLVKQPRRQLFFESAVFVLSGILMMEINRYIYNFPTESGVLLIFGAACLGAFAAIDLSLARERSNAKIFESSSSPEHQPDNIFPITRKTFIVAVLLSITAIGVIVLVLIQDLNWIRDLPPDADLDATIQTILISISFVIGVLLAQSINLMLSYSRNLNMYFKRQTQVLEAVSMGQLDIKVPVMSNDEFGLIARHTNNMITDLQERTESLLNTQSVTIQALASLAETRDNETGRHIIRTQEYVRVLALHLRNHPRFKHALDDDKIDLIYKSAPLHDIGKVGVPDAILLKPGKLNDEEFAEMKRHTEYGHTTLKRAEEQIGSSSFLHIAREIAYTHHEKWDGSGYPRGLSGEDIPISGRLMALADVYDALISKRVYKPAFSHEKARDIILEGRGQHFDTDIVQAFLDCEDAFKEIAKGSPDH